MAGDGGLSGEHNKKHILFVPGKNPKPPPELHRPQLWRCLLDGVRRARPAVAEALAGCPGVFELVAWNRLFYDRDKDITLDLPWIAHLLARPGASAADRREARAWRRRLARWSYQLIDLLPGAARWVPDPAVRASLREIDRYFDNRDGVARRIRDRLKSQLVPALEAGQRVLLIGHSMGSIIAYDCLWELCHRDRGRGVLDELMTLGSPLGLNLVQRRLLGHDRRGRGRYPCRLRRWVNVSAEGDLVSVDRRLADDFGAMRALGLVAEIEDHARGVYTWFRDARGLNAHRSYGYLAHPVVGELVARWWVGEVAAPGATGYNGRGST